MTSVILPMRTAVNDEMPSLANEPITRRDRPVCDCDLA